jgi:hypothetical protein
MTTGSGIVASACRALSGPRGGLPDLAHGTDYGSEVDLTAGLTPGARQQLPQLPQLRLSMSVPTTRSDLCLLAQGQAPVPVRIRPHGRLCVCRGASGSYEMKLDVDAFREQSA